MSNVTPPTDNVNSTPETAVAWIESKVRSHELSTNNGRLWTVAINALAALRRDDEVKDSASMIELLPELTRRWCIANDDSRGDTGRTYASRARSGLSAHLRFLENPGGFRFESKPKAASATPKKKVEKSEPHVPAAVSPPPPDDYESIPIPGKGEFRFRPVSGMTRADAMRVMWGLLVYCEDFDPTSGWNPGMPGIVPHGAPATQ